MSIAKRLILCLQIFAISMGVCGCMTNNIGFTSGKNSITDRMLDYINAKYPEDSFSFASVSGGGAGASSKNIVVSSRNYPDCEVYVRYTQDGENESFTDNYLSVKYEAQTVSLLEKTLVSLVGNDIFLDYDVSRYACPNEDGDMSFTEYISSPSAEIGFTAVVNYDVKDRGQFENDFRSAIVQAKICCFATIYFEGNAEVVRSLTSEGVSSYIYDKSYSDSFSFDMEDCTGFSETIWSD